MLAAAVVAILFIQVYFLRQFYYQQNKLITGALFAAFDDVAAELKKQETFGFFQESVEVNISDKITLDIPAPHASKPPAAIVKSGSHTILLRSTQDTTLPVWDTIKNNDYNISIKASASSNNKEAVFSIKREVGKDVFMVENLDSAHKLLEIKRLEFSQKKKKDAQGKEITKLLNRVVSEIRRADNMSYNTDTLRRLISSHLKNKGLTIDFEFAIEKRQDGKNELLLKSALFNPEAAFFEYNLSINEVLQNHRYLLLQVRDWSGIVMQSMRNMLILSACLSVFVFLAFFYTLRLILRQKQLTDMRNDFVNNMTHELKTPIATVSLALSSLENEQVKNNRERTEFYHRILKEENNKMNAHVERVLQLSLIENGKLVLKFERCDLLSVVRKSISNFELRSAANGIDIVFSGSNEALWISADAEQLELVFNAIIDNAIKYSGVLSPVRVDVLQFNGLAEVYVSDDGKGIAKANQLHIFERFYRVQAGDIHDVKGFGLGLAFAKQIITLHKGTIVCESELGKGCTIICKLPLYV